MALIDKASLLMVPSTYEAGKLYNVLPSGNRAPDNKGGAGYDQTRADFDFDRGSNAAATRIGSDGLLKKYRENLLLRSNQFDTTWVNANSSETSGQADKDGGTNAWKIDISGAGGRIYQSVSQSGVATLSVYAKKGTLDWLIISSNIVDASFNLATGEKGTLVSGIDSRIEDIGNGWYRCSCTGNGSFTQFRFYPAIADNTFTGTSGNIIIMNAQLETGLVATDYLNSTDVTAKAGVLIDLPRINYDANGENGALLLEPSRQNAIQFSEYFGGWTNNAYDAITPNSTTSPEGIDNAYLIETSNNNAGIYVVPSTSLTIGDKLTISVFLKAKSGSNSDIVSFGMGGPTFAGDRLSRFDLSDGTINYENPDHDDVNIQPYGNGWYRCIITDTAVATGVFTFVVYGYGTNCDWYAYGAQAEPSASHSSSYIPNHGESGGVTRAADSLYADNIGQTTAYTIFLDYEDLEQADSNFQDYISFQASGSNQNGLRVEGVGSDWRLYGYGISGSVTFPISGSVSKKKKAIVVSTAGIKLFEDGALTNQDLSGMTIPALGAITTKRGTSAPYPVEIKNSFKQIAVFNEALSDAECISLTS